MALRLPRAGQTTTDAFMDGFNSVYSIRNTERTDEAAQRQHFEAMRRAAQQDALARDSMGIDLGDGNNAAPWADYNPGDTSPYSGTTQRPVTTAAPAPASTQQRNTSNLPWPAGRASSAQPSDLPPASNESTHDVNRYTEGGDLTSDEINAWNAYRQVVGLTIAERGRADPERERIARMRYLTPHGLALRNGRLVRVSSNYSAEALRFRTDQAAPSAPQAPAQAVPSSGTSGSFNMNNPAAVNALQEAMGIPVGNTVRTPEENAALPGSAANSRHLTGEATDFRLSYFPAGTTLQQAEAHVRQRWAAAGFPPAEIGGTNRGTGPHVHVEWGSGTTQTQAATTQQASAEAPYEPALLEQQTQQIRQGHGLAPNHQESLNRVRYLNMVAQNARQYGDNEGFAQAFAALQTEQVNEREFEARAVITRFDRSPQNTQELSQMMAYYYGYATGKNPASFAIHPDSNNPGYFVVTVDGVGIDVISQADLVTEALSATNDTFRSQLQENLLEAQSNVAERSTDAYYDERLARIQSEGRLTEAQMNGMYGLFRQQITSEGQMRVAELQARNRGNRLITAEGPNGEVLVIEQRGDEPINVYEVSSEMVDGPEMTGGFFGLGRRSVQVPRTRFQEVSPSGGSFDVLERFSGG